MSTPGFGAEASLYGTNRLYYQRPATISRSVEHTGWILPAIGGPGVPGGGMPYCISRCLDDHGWDPNDVDARNKCRRYCSPYEPPPAPGGCVKDVNYYICKNAANYWRDACKLGLLGIFIDCDGIADDKIEECCRPPTPSWA